MFCNRAVCGIVYYNEKFLVVSRRNSKEWGLIGGKVDKGETEEEALKRELLEEANLKFEKFFPIYTGLCENDTKDKMYQTTTYLIYGNEINIEEIKEVENGIVPMWKNIEDFYNCENNIFKEYNLKVIENYLKIFKNKDFLNLNV